MPEYAWQALVIDIAHLGGWVAAHFRPALTRSGGWATPVAADGAGFPDLVLVRERLITVECKTERGRLSPAQAMWQAVLLRAGVEAYLWRPSDEAEVRRVLLAGRDGERPG